MAVRVGGRDVVAGRGELLAPLFLAIGVSDFHSDAQVWERRQHLDNPVPLQGEGPFWSSVAGACSSGPRTRARRRLPRARLNAGIAVAAGGS